MTNTLPPRRDQPSPPLPAATLILLRDSRLGPEVLLLQRHSRSAVLPDMYVFPGGRVEQGDLELADRLAANLTRRGSAQAESIDRSFWIDGFDPQRSLGFFIAAVRETFEESGILLARHRSTGGPPAAAWLRQLRDERLALQAGELPFSDFVDRHELDLDLGALAVHARWITPEPVRHRFDTLFFSAIVPADQIALHDGVEATSHSWVRPEHALSEAQRGERRIVFPTACNLETLAAHHTAQAAWEASCARPVVPVLPTVEIRDGERFFVIPPEAGYPTSETLARDR